MFNTEIILRLSNYDVLVVRKHALERLAAEETRCDRLDGRIVEVVIQEYIKWLNQGMCGRAIKTDDARGEGEK
jgi:hypothetical protein